ncbi:hypothetical protein B0H14DRAFT_2607888 [Mycena olivaceomarginata]|nr:hypothetical protein B0H14DRAFT_2607888 [Mycena olivaceomarginata]
MSQPQPDSSSMPPDTSPPASNVSTPRAPPLQLPATAPPASDPSGDTTDSNSATHPEEEPRSCPQEIPGPPELLAIVTRVKPSKELWVYSTKKTFFEKRKQEWLWESEANRAGPFYTKVVKLYFKKYGYHLEDHQDFAVNIADPPDSAADDVVHEVLSPEEVTFQADKLAHGTEWSMCSLVINFYSRKYYDTRVKEQAGAQLRSLQRRVELTGEAVPQAIEVISKVTAEAWDAETAAFRHECQVACEQEYLNAPIENAAGNVSPFVDAIQEKFGMFASILLARPIGIRRGKIGVQSVHAGSTKGLVPINWPDFDWQGFAEVKRCMISFARECFWLPLAPAPPAPPIPLTPAALWPGGGEGVAVGMVPDTIDPDSNEEPAEHSRAEERVRGEIYDKIWQCDDRSEWTLELGCAHAAFKVGCSWGEEWAICVHRFFDFEGTWGFVKGSGQLARKRYYKGQGEELWVAHWWGWWEDQQPKERVHLEKSDLSHSETVDWSTLIMRSLVWWGKVVQTLGGEDTEEWLAAVCDVTWVLERLLESGEIKRAEDDRDDGHASDDEDVHNKEEATPSPKKGNGKRKCGAAKKDKSGEEAEDEAQPVKKKAVQEGAIEAPVIVETVTLVSAAAHTKWRVHSLTCGLGAGDGKQCYDVELRAEEHKK